MQFTSNFPENVLVGLIPKSCMVYIDDVLVIGKVFEEHLANLWKVLERLRAAGLRLKPILQGERWCIWVLSFLGMVYPQILTR